MSKIYNVLIKLPSPLRENATEILDAILASGDLINWDHQLRLITDGRTHPNTNLADLVMHISYPYDERLEEPKGFKVFIEALKNIKLESDWVEHELVKDMLDDSATDDSSEGDDDDDTEDNVDIDAEDDEDNDDDNEGIDEGNDDDDDDDN